MAIWEVSSPHSKNLREQLLYNQVEKAASGSEHGSWAKEGPNKSTTPRYESPKSDKKDKKGVFVNGEHHRRSESMEAFRVKGHVNSAGKDEISNQLEEDKAKERAHKKALSVNGDEIETDANRLEGVQKSKLPTISTGDFDQNSIENNLKKTSIRSSFAELGDYKHGHPLSV